MRSVSKVARGRVCLRFLDYDVTVVSSIESVLQRVAFGFRRMLRADIPDSSFELEIREEHGRYELLRNGELLASYSDLFEAKTVLRHEINRAFIYAYPEFLWMHAGAVAGKDRAALFVGISGRGKSTLITTLCQQGFRYLSDDIIPLDPATGKAIPYPMTPIVRENIGQELPPERVEEIPRTLVELPESTYCREPVSVGSVILPAYSTKCQARILPFSPGTTTLDLVKQCINARVHGASAVTFMAELTASVPVLPIEYSDAQSAANLVSRVLNESSPATYSSIGPAA